MATKFIDLAPALAQTPDNQEMLLHIYGECSGVHTVQIVEVRCIVPETLRVLVRHRNGWHRTLQYGGDYGVNCGDRDGDRGTLFQLGFA